jgi:hypothetical protein
MFQRQVYSEPARTKEEAARRHRMDANGGVMMTYKELCKAFFDELPRREAIDRMLRELPAKMAQAISDHLGAPNGCVGLYQPVADQMGHRTWQPCESDCLQADYDGIYGFCVGIRAQNQPGSLDFSMMYIQFTVEEFDEHSIELRIRNMDGSISIADAHDTASYATAAKITIERIMSDLRNPTALRGSRAPIGFGHHP